MRVWFKIRQKTIIAVNRQLNNTLCLLSYLPHKYRAKKV